MVNIDTVEVFHGGLGLSDAEIHVSHYVNKSEQVAPSFSRAVTAESTLMAPVGLGTSASGRVQWSDRAAPSVICHWTPPLPRARCLIVSNPIKLPSPSPLCASPTDLLSFRHHRPIAALWPLSMSRPGPSTPSLHASSTSLLPRFHLAHPTA